jgi:hypothetical protein
VLPLKESLVQYLNVSVLGRRFLRVRLKGLIGGKMQSMQEKYELAVLPLKESLHSNTKAFHEVDA